MLDPAPEPVPFLGLSADALGRFLEVLRCPTCGEPVAGDPPDLRCPAGHRLAVRDGYLDALTAGTAAAGTSAAGTTDAATEATFASFGYEWTTFSESREEDAAYVTHYLRDLDLDRLKGATGVDAGCGRGRYTRFLARPLAAMVALDGSDAVRSAAANLAGLDNTVVVRADLRQPPLADGAFGFVSSLGVLHHLEDPRAGFTRLVRLLAPGGILLLYLYSRPENPGTWAGRARQAGLTAATALRRVTVRLPHRTLRVLCTPLAALLSVTIVAAGRLGDRIGVAALSGLPMATYRDKPWRSLVLDTFDRLSAPIEHRYVWAELAPWFDQAGLVVEAARDESGWFVVAHRPG